MDGTNSELRQDLTADGFLQVADHTLLAPATTTADLAEFLDSAVAMGVKRVCISPSLLPVEKRGLEVVTVVGFPSGSHRAEVKAFEAERAIADGADEIDMVLNAGLVKSHDWTAVEDEVRRVKASCGGILLKVILETANLTDEEIVEASLASVRGGAQMVKTSTGFSPAGGASVEAVRLMAGAVPGGVGVKASGGIRDAATAKQMWAAGATRFGVSATEAILSGLLGSGAQESAADDVTGGY